MPGQTIIAIAEIGRRSRLQWRAGQLPGQTREQPGNRPIHGRPFNGGPGNCPAKPQHHQGQLPGNVPSMEGRAIARPNGNSTAFAVVVTPSFNGGPGNCPAKRGTGSDQRRDSDLPSMEGRAIARPNELSTAVDGISSVVLQWRAGQLPGQTGGCGRRLARVRRLQWRAGQLPGQTWHPATSDNRSQSPSMEGRAIARPNPR